jgi:hypothetical protein
MSGLYILTNPIKFAVMVPLAEDVYIYVTEPDRTMSEIRPVLYNTKKEAVEAAAIWEGNARVVEYKEESVKGE